MCSKQGPTSGFLSVCNSSLKHNKHTHIHKHKHRRTNTKTHRRTNTQRHKHTPTHTHTSQPGAMGNTPLVSAMCCSCALRSLASSAATALQQGSGLLNDTAKLWLQVPLSFWQCQFGAMPGSTGPIKYYVTPFLTGEHCTDCKLELPITCRALSPIANCRNTTGAYASMRSSLF